MGTSEKWQNIDLKCDLKTDSSEFWMKVTLMCYNDIFDYSKNEVIYLFYYFIVINKVINQKLNQ